MVISMVVLEMRGIRVLPLTGFKETGGHNENKCCFKVKPVKLST